jgi:hypothetical protein
VTRNTILSSMIDFGQKLDQIEIGLRRLLPNRGVSGSKLNCLFHRSYLLVNEISLWLAKVPPGRLMAIIVSVEPQPGSKRMC